MAGRRRQPRFSRETLERLLPTMIETGIQLIEQPFRTGEDALLDGFQSPIPIAADESVQSSETFLDARDVST